MALIPSQLARIHWDITMFTSSSSSSSSSLSLSLSLSLYIYIYISSDEKSNHLRNIFRCWTNQQFRAFNLLINLIKNAFPFLLSLIMPFFFPLRPVIVIFLYYFVGDFIWQWLIWFFLIFVFKETWGHLILPFWLNKASNRNKGKISLF